MPNRRVRKIVRETKASMALGGISSRSASASHRGAAAEEPEVTELIFLSCLLLREYSEDATLYDSGYRLLRKQQRWTSISCI